MNKYIGLVRAKDYFKINAKVRGVYAWYPPPPSDLAEDFIANIHEYYTGLHASSINEIINGKRYNVRVDRQPFLLTSSAIEKKVTRGEVELALEALYEFSSPLYAGKAVGVDGLRNRIKQELEDKEFKKKFIRLANEAGVVMNFNFEDSIIKYFDVSSMLVDKGIKESSVEKLSELIELMIFWAGFPALNVKMGN